MSSSWQEFVKKYVWNETTTPYYVRVERLNRTQAQKEYFVYSFFLAIFFAVFTLFSLANPRIPEDYASISTAFHAFSLFCCAIVLGATKHPYAALYCLSAPVAVFLHIVGDRMAPDLETVEKVILSAFTLLWLRYAFRVLAIARAYPTMPDDFGER